MPRLLPLVALAAVTFTASATGDARRNASWPLSIEPLASPAGPNSAQPQLTVSNRGALLSWVEREGAQASLRFAERTATGWTPPRTVASGTDWFVNWADVPSVLRLADGTLAAHWLQKSGPETYAYDVRLAYSKDDGRTWSAPFTPHHDGTKTEHGFVSLFEMPGAGLGLVWLDGRAMQPDPHGEPASHGRGDMSVRFASFDRAWTQTNDRPIDTRVCECCPTAAAVTSEGVLVAYRDRSDDEIRDIYVSRLENGRWTEGRPVHQDDWRIPMCPVNGPALSADGRRVAIAWFTVKDDEGRAFVAFSDDAGRTFGAPIRLDDVGSLGRVDVSLLPDGSAVASWMEFDNQRAEFRARRVERSGQRSASITVAGVEGSRSSGYPRLARHEHEVIFAWTESTGAGTAAGGLRLRTAAARLPDAGR
jgi:hypothetical protein